MFYIYKDEGRVQGICTKCYQRIYFKKRIFAVERGWKASAITTEAKCMLECNVYDRQTGNDRSANDVVPETYMQGTSPLFTFCGFSIRNGNEDQTIN